MKLEKMSPRYFLEDIPYNRYSQELFDFLFCFPEKDEVFLFSFYEENFNVMDDEYKKFLEERTVFFSDEWLYNVESYGRRSFNRWFIVLDKEDMAKTIEQEFWFLCVVVKKGGSLQDASYVIEMGDYEGPLLIITEKNEGDFLTRVLPKIQEVVSQNIEIVQPGQ